MKIKKNNNLYILTDPLTKSLKINYIKIIKKDDKEHEFYLKVLASVLELKTKTLNKFEFNAAKNDLYQARYSIKTHALKDVVLFQYVVDYISDEYLPIENEKKVNELMQDFIANTAFDEIDVKVALDTLSLSYQMLEDDYMLLCRKITQDNLLGFNEEYNTQASKKNHLENFKLAKLNNCNIEVLGEYCIKQITPGGNPDVFPINTNKIELINPYPVDTNYCEINKELDLDQTNMMVVYNIEGEFKKEVLLMLNMILGGGIFSKLFINVREKASLCYTVYSFLITSNTIGIFCALSEKNTDQACLLIDQQITAIQSGDIDEFKTAKDKIIKDYLKNSNNYYLHKNLIENHLLKGYEYDLDKIIAGINNVTEQEVIKLAKSLVKIKQIKVR